MNRWSCLRHARQEDIDACLNLFKRSFPNGKIHYDVDNIGICENYYRAEEYFFSANSFEFGLVF